jgi:hypothetical protein
MDATFKSGEMGMVNAGGGGQLTLTHLHPGTVGCQGIRQAAETRNAERAGNRILIHSFTLVPARTKLNYWQPHIQLRSEKWKRVSNADQNYLWNISTSKEWVGKYRLLDNKSSTKLSNSKIQLIDSVGAFSSETSAKILSIWIQNMGNKRTPQKKTIISETLVSGGWIQSMICKHRMNRG